METSFLRPPRTTDLFGICLRRAYIHDVVNHHIDTCDRADFLKDFQRGLVWDNACGFVYDGVHCA